MLRCCPLFRCPSGPAAWLSKHARLLNQLDLTITDPEDYDPDDDDSTLSYEQLAAAEQAIAAALQQAASNAAPGQSRGVYVASCEIAYGGTDSAAILQALPGNTLTSLVYRVALPMMQQADVTAALSRIGEALAGLQQLQKLELHSRFDCNQEDVCCGPALFGCSGMSQLTRVELGQVRKHAAASCISPAFQRQDLECAQWD
jgi:hypothetical protein